MNVTFKVRGETVDDLKSAAIEVLDVFANGDEYEHTILAVGETVHNGIYRFVGHVTATILL